MAEELFLDNDFEAEYEIKQKNATTGREEVVPGLVTLKGWISSNRDVLLDGDGNVDMTNDAIHADLIIDVTERTSKAGTYFFIEQGDKLRDHLTSLAGRPVHVRMGDGVNILVSTQRTVQRTRRI